MMTEEQLREPMKRWAGGEESAFEEIVSIALPDLTRIATRLLKRRGIELEPGDLVNGVFAQKRELAPVDDPRSFFALMKKMMNDLAIDHHRAAHRLRRGGGAIHMPILEPEEEFEGASR